MTPERKKKLRTLLRKKAAEELKKEEERKREQRKNTIVARCGVKKDLVNIINDVKWVKAGMHNIRAAGQMWPVEALILACFNGTDGPMGPYSPRTPD